LTCFRVDISQGKKECLRGVKAPLLNKGGGNMVRIVEFIRKLWGGVTKFVKTLWGWVVNIDNWIEMFKPGFILLLFAMISIYLIYDILGKVPQALHINLVILSATLGGLVFAGASFIGKGTADRKRLMNVAKMFIIATFLYIIFFIFFTFIQDKNINAFSFEGGVVNTILFWLAALGIYGGSYFFACALVDFIISLRKIS